jgi:hypothetical protein
VGYMTLNMGRNMKCDILFKFSAVYLTTLSAPQTIDLYSPLVDDDLERICPGRCSKRAPPETVLERYLYVTMLSSDGFKWQEWKRSWINLNYYPRVSLFMYVYI